MKIMFSSRRHHYLARVGIFLVMIVLIVGIVGCGGGGGGVEYDLSITSTTGGSVTTPGENTYTYDEGEAVNLVAEAEEGYYFVNWTGDVGTIANVEDATTTITMLNQYSITANFEATVPEVLFSDDFSDEAGVWDTFSDEDGSVFYENGWLHLVNYTLATFGTDTRAYQYFTDFILEVETKLVGGTDDNFHSVQCRYQDSSNYYDFYISADGYYGISKLVDGDFTVFVGPNYSPSINQGVDAMNLIHIECIGSSLSLSVNEHLLWEGTDATFTGGDIALKASAFAGTLTEIAFDNIVVSEP